MANQVMITTDSTTDLGPELIERYHIATLPLCITLSDGTYRDGIDMTPDIIYDHYERNRELPKTAAPNLEDCREFFRKYTEQGFDIVHYTISSDMSSTFNNCRLAAEEFPGVTCVDTQNLSSGGGLLALHGAEMAAAGKSAEEIVKECEAMVPNVDASFVIDNLEFLYKGGRCSALAAFGANLLKLKPMIEVKNGKMGVGKKYRGKFEAVLREYVKERIGDGSDLVPDHVFVTHAGVDDALAQSIGDLVMECFPFKHLHITKASCTISSHCGRNTLGVLFVRKSPIA